MGLGAYPLSEAEKWCFGQNNPLAGFMYHAHARGAMIDREIPKTIQRGRVGKDTARLSRCTYVMVPRCSVGAANAWSRPNETPWLKDN